MIKPNPPLTWNQIRHLLSDYSQQKNAFLFADFFLFTVVTQTLFSVSFITHEHLFLRAYLWYSLIHLPSVYFIILPGKSIVVITLFTTTRILILHRITVPVCTTFKLVVNLGEFVLASANNISRSRLWSLPLHLWLHPSVSYPQIRIIKYSEHFFATLRIHLKQITWCCVVSIYLCLYFNYYRCLRVL